tara:strand:+ start:871 stop:2373 length:1503 start_codon:yes stop_codon:yes gene_type:complete
MKRRSIRKITTEPLEHNKKEAHFPRVTIRPNSPTRVPHSANIVQARTFRKPQTLTEPKPIEFATKIIQTDKEACFIVGSGPSLTGFDFNQLSGFDTIAVNKAVEYLHNPTYFITTDYTYFLKASLPIEKINIKTQHSYFVANMIPDYMSFNNGYVVDARDNRQYNDLYKYGSVIKSSKKVGFGSTLKDFHNGNNSGHCAIQLALLKGYKKIYLLGFDLMPNTQTHFHQSYSQVHQDSFRKRSGEYGKTLLASLATHNSSQQIINLSSSSVLVKSPHIKTQSFTEAISNLEISTIKPAINNNDNLIVVGYYTVNTPYEDEAKNLLRSLNKFTINHDITGVKTLGNWQANTRFKAEFMLDMLIKWPKHNLLYVDVDAVIHRPLDLFKNYNCDIAVRWQDFRWRKNECLSGTIYMENNKRTKQLCELWRDINIKEGNQSNRMEQWNLDTVINKMKADPKFTYRNLPPEYTFIFDIMKGIYPNVQPVIEHYQASRRFKKDVNEI